jgi:methylglutaconyl-CoA hydratase
MPLYNHLRLDANGPVATLTLARPHLHNAFDAQTIAEVTQCAQRLAEDTATRVVVLTGEGRSFCAGADLHWMRQSLEWSTEENKADAERLAAMYEALDTLPQALIGRINGHALGGGAGLVACCDLALAVETAQFAFSEVRLGILPAVISRYVIPKIGISQARALFVSAERFTAMRAFEIGFVHGVVPADELDDNVLAVVGKILKNGPEAVAAAKRLVRAVAALPPEAARRYAVEAIAAARTGGEGQAGITAFLERRKAPWAPPDS